MSVALIAGGTALASAGAGAYSASESSSAANKANAMNYKAQEKQRAFDMLMNSIAMRKSEEGSQTPYYSTVYVPGVGWQTKLSPIGNDLFTASNEVQLGQDRDQMSQLAEQQQARVRRGQQGQIADVLAKRFMQGNGMLTADYESLMRQGATQSAKRAVDDTERQAGTQLLRQGADPSAFMKAIAGERANAYDNAQADIPLNARLQFENSRDTFNNNAANLYGQFSNAASSISGAPFTPFDVSPTTSAVQAGQNNGTQALALAKSGNTIPQAQPMTNPWNSIGSAFGGIGMMANSGSFDSLGKLLNNRQGAPVSSGRSFDKALRSAAIY